MNHAVILSTVIGLAVLVDLLVGDPPNRFHPVAAMGKYIQLWKSNSPPSGAVRRFCWGIGVVSTGMLLFGGIGWVIARGCELAPVAVSIVIQALLLKMTFSLKSLIKAGHIVLDELKKGQLGAARESLSWHLVSRETEQLTESEIAGAAIESLSENLTDSVVAPLCCYLLGGLPAAIAYRFLNTCDAMLGYRTPEYEWLGKFAARCDDLANLVPARLATVCLWFSIVIQRGNPLQAINVWWSDRNKTSSPNAGQTMSLTAGGLGVVLVKPEVYQLGAGLRAPTVDDLQRAIDLLWLAAMLFMVIISVALIGWGTLL